MATYIAFLRAINVGGRFVKMERLRELFGGVGFTRVRSVIQSGNIVFEAAGDANQAEMTHRIESCLAEALGYDVAAMVRTVAQVEAAVALDPFRGVDITPDTRLCVLFVSQPLPPSVRLPYASAKGDYEILAATPGEVFVVMRQSAGRPGNPTAYLEKTYRLKATARFSSALATILKSAKQ